MTPSNKSLLHRKPTVVTTYYDIASMGNISRCEKGFYFEMNIQMLLDDHDISYEGNPIFYDEWKKYTNTGYDVRIKELHLKIECKYLSKPIYESWFRRDWLSRDADIYVTTNPEYVPYRCRKQLTNLGKKLFTPHQFLSHIQRLLRGNKSIDLNVYFRTLNNELSFVQDILECRDNVQSDKNRVKTKLQLPTNSSNHEPQPRLGSNRCSRSSFTEENHEKKESLSSIFQNVLRSIDSIPFEREDLIKNIERELVDLLYTCLLPDTYRFRVRTKSSQMNARRYLRKYARNLFQSMFYVREYEGRVKIPITDLPKILHHGTTTEFLPEIMKEGLLPSKAGRCWSEDKEERVYLTNSMYAAEAFALKAIRKFGGRPVILEIKVGDFGNSPLFGCEIFKDEYPAAFDTYSQLALEEPITSQDIKNYCILPKNHSLFLLLQKIKQFYFSKKYKEDNMLKAIA